MFEWKRERILDFIRVFEINDAGRHGMKGDGGWEKRSNNRETKCRVEK